MKVVITEAAWSDMLDIARAIASDSPSRAEPFLDELYNACREIGDMPLAYPLARGYEIAGIRKRVVGNYLIFFRFSRDEISVLHVLHGARDYERILSKDR